MSSLGIEPDIDLRDILEISVSNEWSVQFSPLLRGPAGAQGGTFIRRAAPWKGLKKRPGESFGEYQDRLAEVNEDVASGLGTARSMAMDAAEDGLCVVESDGEVYPVPQTAGNLMEEAGSGQILASGFQSAAGAIREAVSRGAARPRHPTVY